jgi:hypothetical protein
VDPCQEVGLKYGIITKQRTNKFGVVFLLTRSPKVLAPSLRRLRCRPRPARAGVASRPDAAGRASLPACSAAAPPAPSCSLQIRLGFGLVWRRPGFVCLTEVGRGGQVGFISKRGEEGGQHSFLRRSHTVRLDGFSTQHRAENRIRLSVLKCQEPEKTDVGYFC